MMMLAQNSLPDTLGPELSFESDLEEQESVELLCDWSLCGGIWQKSLDNEHELNNCRTICSGDDEASKISGSEVVEISRSSSGLSFSQKSSDISVAKDMSVNCACKWDGIVYKRRRLEQNTVCLLSKDNAMDSDNVVIGSHSSIISTSNPLTAQKTALITAPVFIFGGSTGQPLECGRSSTSGQNHLQKLNTISHSQINGSKNSVPLELKQYNRLLRKEATLSGEISVKQHWKYAPDNYPHIQASCLASKCDTKQDSVVMMTEAGCRECPSGEIIVSEPHEDITSARELCISVLQRYGLLEGVNSLKSCVSSEDLGVIDADVYQSCKICSLLENPSKMLICDLCEDAFHLSCCQPKVKKVAVDYWYCRSCFRKRPKGLLENSSGLANILSDDRWRKSCNRGSPILWMLRNNQPYTSKVPIGKDFQVEVPPWTGPISEDFNYFNEQMALNLDDHANPDGQNAENTYKHSTFCNWIQCREVLRRSSKDKGTICGKWRRAPLFVVQTDDWNCSCSVLWDPIHADCGVPQELETDVILKQLEYFDMLKSRLNI